MPNEWARDRGLYAVSSGKRTGKATPSIEYSNEVIEIIVENDRLEIQPMIEEAPWKEQAGERYLDLIREFLEAVRDHQPPPDASRWAWESGTRVLRMIAEPPVH